MLLHDLKDVRNGRVITKDVISKDDDFMSESERAEFMKNYNREMDIAVKNGNSAEIMRLKRLMEKAVQEGQKIGDSKTKDDWGNILQDKIERAIKENKSEYEINKLKEDLKQWIKDQRQLQGGRIKDSKSTKDSKTKDADYKDYYDVGKDVGLSGEKLIQYVEYMRQRWPEKEKVQGELNGYCKEWARRFARGDAWKLSDLSGQRILERMGITDSKSTKDQIAELECQKEQAKKQGYGTDAYDAAIANLQKYSTDGGPGSGQKGHTTPDPTTHQERRKERENLMIYYKNAVKRGDRETAQKISQRLQYINSLQLKDSDDTFTQDPLLKKEKRYWKQ